MTNEGRAMQGMDNGNSAIDALIASSAMQNGVVSPKSPHYQAGGVVDVLKEAMSQYGGGFDESLYTPEGGRTKLGYAKERGLTPESVAIDTLYFKNPGAYEFLISGKTPSGAKVSGAETGLNVALDAYGTSKYDEEISKWRGTPLKGDVSQLISDKYGSLYDSMKAHKDFESKIESAILPKGTNQKMLRQAKIMVRGGMEPDIDRALASLVDIEKNRGAIEAARETARAAKEKQTMMKALGMNEKEYDDFQAMKAKLGKKNYQEGGEVGWGDFTTPEDFNKHLVYNKLYNKMAEANGRGTEYSDALSKQIALSEEGDPKQLLMDRMMERSAYGNGAEQYGVLEDTKFKDLTSGLQMGSELTAVPRFKVSEEYAKEGDLEKRVGTSREQVSLGSLPVLSALSSLASKAGVTPESKIGRLLNAPLPLTLEKDIPSGKRSYSLGYTPEYQKQGGPIDYYQTGGQVLPRKQQEMRSPEMYGPPVPADLMTPAPDTSAQDTSGAALDSMLMQLMMRDVNQSVNPFTGDTLDDSLQLLDSMRKSKIPRDSSRVIMQQGGMVESPQLMQDMSQDRRIKPLQPDRYVIKDDTPGGEGQREMSVPKLHSAYLGALGMETPLSKRQGALLSERGIPPQSMAPHLESLVGRVLIQRLGNEPQ